MDWRVANWRCPRCRARARRYEGEELVRDVCWSCWMARFPTFEQREAELVARDRNRQKLLEGAARLRAAHARISANRAAGLPIVS